MKVFDSLSILYSKNIIGNILKSLCDGLNKL